METTIDFEANSEDRVNLYRLKQLFSQDTDSQMIHVSIRLMAFVSKKMNREHIALLLGEFGRGGGFETEKIAVKRARKTDELKNRAVARDRFNNPDLENLANIEKTCDFY